MALPAPLNHALEVITPHLPLIGAALAGLLIGLLFAWLLAQLGRAKREALTLAEHQSVVAELTASNVQLDTRLDTLQQQLSQMEQSVLEQQRLHSEQQQQLNHRGEKIASLETALQHERRVGEEKLRDLQAAREQLSRDFENLANRIFDEKTERFALNSKRSLDQTLAPLRDQLSDFKQRVEDVYDKDNRERISLATQLNQLKELNQQMSRDALNLTNALKGDNKTQGNWGEVILERVLEESGLHKGREYETQVSLSSEQGRSRPDVIVRLPENKDIVIDSKVSLLHYERYCSIEDEGEKQQALRDHALSVREHIKGLSIKNYENLPGLRTLDFVFIFIPIEAAFMAAFEQDQTMFRDAYEKNIIVVGPTTLLATLRTVQSIWRYERQNKNAEEIARQAGAMHDKFVAFVDDIDKIAVHIERAHEAQASAMNKLKSGKGNLVNRIVALEKLGAKAKKSLPRSVTEEARAAADETAVTSLEGSLEQGDEEERQLSLESDTPD